MRTILKFGILLIIFTISITLYAQDIKDPLPVIDTTNTMLEKHTNKFIKSWNWASIDSKLDDAMLINFNNHGFDWLPWDWPPPSYQYAQSQRLLIENGYVGAGDCYYSILQAPAIEYSPVVTFYTNPNFDPQQFTPLSNDDKGRVFGFKNIDLNIGSFKGFEYQLNKNGVTSPTLVLSSPWPDDEMIGMYAVTDTNNLMNPLKGGNDRNGINWYLSINLKTLETITPINQNDTVLILKVPYYLYNNTTKYYIKFNQRPVTNNLSTDTVHLWSVRTSPDYRGLARRDTLTSDTLIAITGKMLKINSMGNPGTNITLSGYFILDPYNSPNPYLQTDEGRNGKDITKISHLGLEVYYCGNINVSVNWLRYECPHAQDLLRGKLDGQINDSLTHMLNAFQAVRPDLRIHRFYGIDEFWLQNWLSERYFNKLVNNMGASEVDPFYYPQYQQCLDFPELWLGPTFGMGREVAAPYFRKTNRYTTCQGSNSGDIIQQVFNYKNGYYGFWKADTTYNRDTLKSEYESFLIHQYPTNNGCIYGSYWYYDHVPLPILPNNNIWENCDYNPNGYYLCESPLSVMEKQLYQNFYTKNSFLFSDKPWWANMWLSNERWYGDTITKEIYLVQRRPLTGEEVRLFNNLPLILGCKGLDYWWGTSDFNIDINGNLLFGSIGMASFNGTHNELPTGDDLLNSSLIGGDFIQFPSDPSTFTKFLNINSILWDTLAISQNRMYVGRASARWETTKLNRWIEAVQDTLMNLHLTAWYAHGFKNWYIQDPIFNQHNPNLLNSLIDLNNIKIRRIGAIEANGMPHYEPNDSSFYDITCLVDPTDYPGPDPFKSSYYIAVQNRRTDPLILHLDSLKNRKDMSLYFYSTAEFDKYANEGGYRLSDNSYQTPAYWQNLWWRRLGCRELQIPLRNQITGDSPYKLLRVKELGIGTWLDSFWYRKAPFTHRIDTLVGCDSIIIVRLLPGEAKILHVEVIYPSDTLFTSDNEININVFPNPAVNLVNVSAKLPLSEFGKGNQDIILIMYSIVGKELQRAITHTGEIVSLPIEMCSTGAYFIVAEISTKNGQQGLKPGFKSFIIQR